MVDEFQFERPTTRETMLLFSIDGNAEEVRVELHQDGEACGHFSGCPCRAICDAAWKALEIITPNLNHVELLRQGGRLFSRALAAWRKSAREGNFSLAIKLEPLI